MRIGIEGVGGGEIIEGGIWKMSEKYRKFWMLCICDGCDYEPLYGKTYGTELEATIEAEGLCMAKGTPIIVLETTKVCKPIKLPVEWESILLGGGK
jgi:hypothetical protein